MTEWTEAGLRLADFTGFRRFADLATSPPPAGQGVYVVLRLATAAPMFLPANPSAQRAGRDASRPDVYLAARWVAETPVVYIGKASLGKDGDRGLRRRLQEFVRHGSGQQWGHRGGEWIWQLADASELVVGWRETPDAAPEDVEAELLNAFEATYGRLPFANRKRGRRRSP